jgi:serine/threonine-protein kinase
MSSTPSGDRVTCPRCQLSFSASASPGNGEVAAIPGTGTVTILPEEAGAGPSPPETPSSNLPQRLGRFEIVRCLGEGAFGRVYEAHDPLLRRTVALKVAKPEQLAGQKRVERFQREARAAANLQHPHIVAVFDSGQDGQHHYIASALVPGRALSVVLAELPSGERLPLRESVQIVRKLAEALGYAHKQGVVHRDVKPGNVMLRDDGEPLILDFGIAARAGRTPGNRERASGGGQTGVQGRF